MVRIRRIPLNPTLIPTLALALSLGLPACGGSPTTSTDTDSGTAVDDLATPDVPALEETTGEDATPACENGCATLDERTCQANQAVTCGNWDDDACLEWGNAIECQGGCLNGFCTQGCENQCTVVGSKKCSGNRVQSCGDYDSSGCLEWGGDQDCGALSCSNGFCAATCQNECTVVGARSCEGSSAYKVCGNGDGDDCLEWGTPTDCQEGETCSNGNCKTGCANECTVVGAKVCNDSNTGYKVCGDTDTDPCLEWGSDNPCGVGLVCSNAQCASTCKDECAAVGAKKCNDGKTGFTVCDDRNEDGCLEWGSATDCAGGETCSNGLCALSCKDECTTPEARRCDAAGGGYQVCDDTNEDGCLEWGSTTGCGDNETCSGGYCSLACASECTVAEAKTCNGSNTGYRVCKDANSDGCFEWSGDINCDVGQVCSNGMCGVTCQDECTAKGAKSCDGALGYKVCDVRTVGGCLTWGSVVQCGAGETCAAGFCQVGCTNGCGASGLKECSDSHTGVRTCGDYNEDGCLEWGTDQACDAGQTCANGLCAATCQDECADKGVASCNVDATGFQVCEDFNRDGCLELGTITPCGLAATCQSGACQLKPLPDDVVISEVLYDPSGVDTTGFVELWGTPGTSLPGFSLVGIDGATGNEYNVIQLSGSIPSDGYFVVSQAEAAYADMVTAKANFQNGPDSIALKWGTDVVDAVGYGVFAAHFAGELAPAPDVADGHSLGRDEEQDDTNNNSVDFHDCVVPSPGAPNAVQPPNVQAPVASFTATPMENATVLVDASASSDLETPAADLEVRWDFQNDGTWETAFSRTRQESHTYPGNGTYTIKLEVRDGGGKTSIAIQTVNLAAAQNVQGEVTTTTWSGLVNVVGHVTVPLDETLTIEAGTVVNVKGLFKIDIKGRIQVKGEAGAPVTFTSPDRTAGAWAGMAVGYTVDNYIKFAVFEYADVGLTYGTRTGTLTDSTFRYNQTAGLYLYRLNQGTDVILERLTATKNEGVGIDIREGRSFNLKYATATENGGHGLRLQSIEYDPVTVTNATLALNGGNGAYGTRVFATLDHCDISGNEYGIEFYSYHMDVTNSRVTANRREGVLVNNQFGVGSDGQYQYMFLTGNDIFGNTTVEGTVMATIDQEMSTYDAAGFTGTRYTDFLSSAHGEDLRYAWFEYSEGEQYGHDDIQGALLRNDSDTEIAYPIAAGATSIWVALQNTAGLVKIRGRIVDNHLSNSGTLTLHSALYFTPAANLANPIELIAIISQGMNINDNYWGVTTIEDVNLRIIDGKKTVSNTPTIKTAPIPGAGVQPM